MKGRGASACTKAGALASQRLAAYRLAYVSGNWCAQRREFDYGVGGVLARRSATLTVEERSD